MNPTFHVDVHTALRTLLVQVVGIPADQYIAVEGRDFTKPSGVPWVRERYAPGPERLQSIPKDLGRIRMDAVYFVDLFFPSDTGTTAAETLVSSLRQTFRPGKQFTYNGQTITVVSTSRMQGRDQDGWYMIPVTVKFYTYDFN